MIPVALPNDINDVLVALQEIIRRAVDGTGVPIFVDVPNQRIIIGGTSSSSSTSKLEVVGGDVKIYTAGSGVIIPDRSGLRYYRVLIEDDGAVSADPL